MMYLKKSQIAVGLAACLGASLGILSSAVANPLSGAMDRELMSQASDTWNAHGDVPVLDNTTVQGRITSINGDEVQLALANNGGTKTYKVPAFDQRLYGLKVGSNATFTIRRSDGYVVAISDVTSDAGSNR